MEDRRQRDFVRILVTGSDRAKFLHNFCTNNIKAMTPGQLLEAFFVNVQAKVQAHGYVAAFETHLEIWMLAGDPAGLVRHLSRYVISEDVQVELASGITHAFRIVGTEPRGSYSASYAEPGCGSSSAAGAETHAVWFTWGSEVLTIIGGAAEAVAAVESQSEGMYQAIDADHFEVLRIEERYPLIGVDITSDHLAPEADRNSVAISYTKGCYLGQEPIARIDALGHVNKSLKRVRLRSEAGPLTDITPIIGSQLRTSDDQSDGRNVVGTVTSVAVRQSDVFGLSVLKVSAANQSLRLVDQNGHAWIADC